jgi:hypothetical protein
MFLQKVKMGKTKTPAFMQLDATRTKLSAENIAVFKPKRLNFLLKTLPFCSIYLLIVWNSGFKRFSENTKPKHLIQK